VVSASVPLALRMAAMVIADLLSAPGAEVLLDVAKR